MSLKIADPFTNIPIPKIKHKNANSRNNPQNNFSNQEPENSSLTINLAR